MKVLMTARWVEHFAKMFQEEFPQVEFVFAETAEEIAAKAADAEIAYGPLNSSQLQAAPNLRYIQSASAGVEWMRNAPELAERQITVCNTRGAHASTIAEHTMGMLVFIARGFDSIYEAQKRHEWKNPPAKPLFGLAGLKMGIIGLGRIGQAIAARSQAFEMNVIAHDPYLPPQAAAEIDVPLLDLREVYANSDYLTLHALVTDETRGMINARTIATMKDGIRIINAARGALINSADLAAALSSGKVAGAALDVFEQEPPPTDHPLIGHPKVIHTPHLAASTSDAQVPVAIEAAQLILDFLLDGKTANVCNPEVLEV